MPFRLLNPAAAQCADTAVAQRRRSSVTTALQRSRDNAVVQCEGTTRAGRRCAVTTKTDFRDELGASSQSLDVKAHESASSRFLCILL